MKSVNYLPHHTAISVRNLDETLHFYEALGFRQVHRYDDPDKVGIKLKLGISFLEIFAYHKNRDCEPLENELGNDLDKIGIKHIALTTDDVDAALAELKEKGLATDQTTILTKGDSRFFFIKDPDGMWVEIIKDNRYS